MPTSAKPTLATLEDFFRLAVRRFRAARLAYGHGTTNAVDEAAFMMLEALRLPIHTIDPWLALRPTSAERIRLSTLIEARVGLRMPAPYLLGAAYMRGVRFQVDRRALIPRSFIGDLLFDGVLPVDPRRVRRVLDLCTGSGCLAILAARFFPNAEIDAADLSAAALEVAQINVDDHDLTNRINLLHGDLFEAIEGGTYDLIITNPPYVAETEADAFTPEYGHEPIMAHLGGDDGLDIVRRILDEAADHLNPGGGLLCEIGTGRDILIAEYPHLDFLWLDTEESEGEVFWITREALTA